MRRERCRRGRGSRKGRKQERHVPERRGLLRMARMLQIVGHRIVSAGDVGDDEGEGYEQAQPQGGLAERAPSVDSVIIGDGRAGRSQEDREPIGRRGDEAEGASRRRDFSGEPRRLTTVHRAARLFALVEVFARFGREGRVDATRLRSRIDNFRKVQHRPHPSTWGARPQICRLPLRH